MRREGSSSPSSPLFSVLTFIALSLLSGGANVTIKRLLALLLFDDLVQSIEEQPQDFLVLHLGLQHHGEHLQVVGRHTISQAFDNPRVGHGRWEDLFFEYRIDAGGGHREK